jgi:hypothetical protein
LIFSLVKVSMCAHNFNYANPCYPAFHAENRIFGNSATPSSLLLPMIRFAASFSSSFALLKKAANLPFIYECFRGHSSVRMTYVSLEECPLTFYSHLSRNAVTSARMAADSKCPVGYFFKTQASDAFLFAYTCCSSRSIRSSPSGGVRRS